VDPGDHDVTWQSRGFNHPRKIIFGGAPTKGSLKLVVRCNFIGGAASMFGSANFCLFSFSCGLCPDAVEGWNRSRRDHPVRVWRAQIWLPFRKLGTGSPTLVVRSYTFVGIAYTLKLVNFCLLRVHALWLRGTSRQPKRSKRTLSLRQRDRDKHMQS